MHHGQTIPEYFRNSNEKCSFFSGQGVTLENVIAHGVEFQPEILEWIKRLLNPNTIAYLADHSANQEAGVDFILVVELEQY